MYKILLLIKYKQCIRIKYKELNDSKQAKQIQIFAPHLRFPQEIEWLQMTLFCNGNFSSFFPGISR